MLPLRRPLSAVLALVEARGVAAATCGASSVASGAAEVSSAGAARSPLRQHAARLHVSSAAAQKTAAAVGAKAAAAAKGAAAKGAAAAPAPGGPLGAAAGTDASARPAYDFTKSLLPRHQVIYTPPSPPSSSAWTAESRRVGVLALKCGMTADWDKWGQRRALTVLKLEEVIVTGIATEETRGYTALQVGAGIPKFKNVAKPQRGACARG
jgi:hypothetical protein